MVNRQLIVSDLDGTLLNEKHEIPVHVKESIQAFQERGGVFTFATGRMNESIEEFVTECRITAPIITYNGAQIYCPITNQTIYEKTFSLSEELQEYVLRSYKEFAEVLLFSADKIYTFEKGEQIIAFEKKEGVVSKVIFQDEMPVEITKIIIMSTQLQTLKQYETECNSTFPQIDTVYSEPNYLELLPKHTSKGNALRYLKTYLNMKDCYVTTFGNHLNDISLLQAADCGIAVNNAIDEVKERADIVLDYTNVEGAIGYYIEGKTNQYQILEGIK